MRVLCLAAMAISVLAADAAPHATTPAPAPASSSTIVPGPWRAPRDLIQRPIWPGAAPDGTFRPQPPESVQRFVDPVAPGGISEAALNVAVPTMTIVPPRGRPARTAIVVFPGGGFQKVFLGMEGTEICDWLASKGVTCIVSKYRAPGGDDFWDARSHRQIRPAIPRALQDAQRTIRLVRSMARGLGVDPHRIGALGLSAGGYLVAQASNMSASYRPVDAADRLSPRPDFAIMLYPGHICRGASSFDQMLPVTRAAPPTFIAQAWDDPTDPVCNSLLYATALNRAGVSAELHLFAKGGHAFALRHPAEPVGQWPALVQRWLGTIGAL